MRLKMALFALLCSSAALWPSAAAADCDCVSVAADIGGKAGAVVMKADNLYAAGDYEAALAIYTEAYAATKAPELLYAQAQCQLKLENAAEARAKLEAYLKSGAEGSLKYEARARGALSGIAGGVSAAAEGATGLAGGTVGAVKGGAKGGLKAGTGAAKAGVGAAAAGTGAAVDSGADLAGSLDKKAKPPKVAKGAAIVLGVVAVAAVGAVAVQSISAGVKDDVDFDTKFNLSLGATGAVVGGTAIYLWGLTAASGAAAGAGGVDCPELATKAIIAPVAHRGGAGVAAALSF